MGGDFHDHFLLADGRCVLVVADVSDKGVAAGLFAMVCRTLLRAVALQRQADPPEVARHVNEGLCADNESSMFVTAFVGQYHPESARLDYVSAGHPPSLLVRSNGACEWLSPTGGAALGVVEEARYAQATVVLLPGDTVFAYTDGVTEAENAQGELFGRARLQTLFEQRPCASAREAVDRVLQAVADFSQGAQPSDDITCMALQCHRNGAPA
ncbi:PP2C family protein-serine/threonine phosphatase [Ramlibacter rhizophilus]|uniref:PP2C family protein-serine/threonine phosphatase n=1 Tax=Ramlibacter rhizophilus TaxID=1781167 RepID=UPI0014323B11|nr:PP2C family protein-serine/threonine phosphatase [Ramlibacter rhizophilus]